VLAVPEQGARRSWRAGARGMRVRDGEHALHADRAVEHTRLAALASVRAVLPTHAHPAVERTIYDGDAPLEDSVRDGAPATAGAPSTGGVHSSCCVAMSRRAARAPRPAAARRPEGPGVHERANG